MPQRGLPGANGLPISRISSIQPHLQNPENPRGLTDPDQSTTANGHEYLPRTSFGFQKACPPFLKSTEPLICPLGWTNDPRIFLTPTSSPSCESTSRRISGCVSLRSQSSSGSSPQALVFPSLSSLYRSDGCSSQLSHPVNSFLTIPTHSQ